MKLFAFIISVYILVLSVTPCIDVPEDDVLHKTEQAQNTNDKHQNDTDHCSPFCTCYCCASPIVFQVYSIEFKCLSIVQEYFSEYKSTFDSFNFTSIWQPPKMS